MKKILLIAVAALLSMSPSLQTLPEAPKPRNIILLIGDGMGLAQVSTLYYYGNEPSQFSRFRYIGLHHNPASDAKVTDSAAGATAFSTGYRAYNAAIGMDADTVPRETILEIAARLGKRTGLVATCAITHATPAAFFAHVVHRDSEELIAKQYVNSSVYFAAAGGYHFFTQREDNQDLLKALSAKGVLVDTVDLPKKTLPSTRQAYFLAPTGMPTMQAGRGNFLPRATQLAIDNLSPNKSGFFLMVEGSQIDWGGHANNFEYLKEEMIDFNRAIRVALDFAKKDGNTLVIVTADHETGGLSLSASGTYEDADYTKITPTFSTRNHSATLIPVFAYGPGAEAFMGVYENNEIFGKMRAGWR